MGVSLAVHPHNPLFPPANVLFIAENRAPIRCGGLGGGFDFTALLRLCYDSSPAPHRTKHLRQPFG